MGWLNSIPRTWLRGTSLVTTTLMVEAPNKELQQLVLLTRSVKMWVKDPACQAHSLTLWEMLLNMETLLKKNGQEPELESLIKAQQFISP